MARPGNGSPHLCVYSIGQSLVTWALLEARKARKRSHLCLGGKQTPDDLAALCPPLSVIPQASLLLPPDTPVCSSFLFFAALVITIAILYLFV